MWRRPWSCEPHAHDSYEPYDSDDSYEPHDSYDSYELCAAYEPNESHEPRDPNEFCDPNESHQPGGPGQCTVTASCMRWPTWATHLALGFVNIWSRGGS
ncbi:hypothetical protein [Mycobacterium colombiense]|uniref:hypothetical protein n=1 Tax=Mycobacterium colombiense TaxID=339268 RepID=UPI0007ECDEA8|nr:hypothetical protein [Mycobacterium colombiense]OBJ36322.1 hypothetical protein A5620_19895 [Mycobacterium colombiense]